MSTQVIRWGIATGLIGFIWLVAEYIAGLHGRYVAYHPVVTIFSAIIPVICLPLGMRSFRNLENGGFATSMQLIRAGIFMSFISTVIAVAAQLIYHLLINPHYFDFMIKTSVEMASQKHLDTAKAYQNATIYYTLPSYLIQVITNTLGGGIIISAVAAFFLRRRKRGVS